MGWDGMRDEMDGGLESWRGVGNLEGSWMGVGRE
jgi:hypothetical protein